MAAFSICYPLNIIWEAAAGRDKERKIVKPIKFQTETLPNILSACLKCNGLKGDKHANYSGRSGVAGSLRPLKMPRRPTAAELLRAGLEFLPNDVREDFSAWLYWQVEIEP